MNFAPGRLRRTAPIRWNREMGEFEMRCDDCSAKHQGQSFWPITPEFWWPRSMQRCRACEGERNRAARRAACAADRERQLRLQRARDRRYRRPHVKKAA